MLSVGEGRSAKVFMSKDFLAKNRATETDGPPEVQDWGRTPE